MSKHTNGPWESLDDCVRVDNVKSEFHHIEVCQLHDYLPERKANALLIAAAPDLLDACIECAARLREVLLDGNTENNHTVDQRNILAQTEAAIAKAEGSAS